MYIALASALSSNRCCKWADWASTSWPLHCAIQQFHHFGPAGGVKTHGCCSRAMVRWMQSYSACANAAEGLVDRVGRPVQHLGNRLGRRFAAVAGLQKLAVAPRQFGHAAVQRLQPQSDLLAAFDILVRDQLQRGRIKAQPVAAAVLAKIHDFVLRHPARPSQEIGARLEGRELLEERQAGLLQHVVGVRTVPQKRYDERIDAGLVGEKQGHKVLRRVATVGSQCCARRWRQIKPRQCRQ